MSPIEPTGPVRYLQAAENYCWHYPLVGKARLCSYPLTYWLSRQYAGLLRIHRSYAVAPTQIERLIRGRANAWQVELTDGTRLPVARRRQAAVQLALGFAHRKLIR